jgi:hypothetical protein
MIDIRCFLLFLDLCSPPLILAQGCAAPPGTSPAIPVGERTGIMGSVKDSNGDPVPGAQVTVAAIDTQRTTTTIASSNGTFELPCVPGNNRVTATAQGFAQQTTEIMVKEGQVPFLGLVLVGSGASGGVEVLEKSFNDEIELQAWLNAQAEKGKRLRGIIPLEYRKSLFLLAEDKATIPDFVQRVDGRLLSEELVTRIKSNPDKTFVGVHRLTDNSYLMVFYGKH